MIDFAYLIKNEGYTERWGGRESKALNIGKMKYWTMDDPLENTDLINRAYVDDDFWQKMSHFVQSDAFVFVRGMSMADVRREMKNNR